MAEITFTTAKEAKRALYEESLRTKVKVSTMLDIGVLRKFFKRHPILVVVLAYFASPAWQEEKKSVDAELLAFGEKCEELARQHAEMEEWRSCRSWSRGESVGITPEQLKGVGIAPEHHEGSTTTREQGRTVSGCWSESHGWSESWSESESYSDRGDYQSKTDSDYNGNR